MSTTSTERMRERRRRRARRDVQLTIVLHEDDLAEIAERGYEGASAVTAGARHLGNCHRHLWANLESSRRAKARKTNTRTFFMAVRLLYRRKK
jgi:hypothetical protein